MTYPNSLNTLLDMRLQMRNISKNQMEDSCSQLFCLRCYAALTPVRT
jgi:hypothetical protein